MKLIPIIIGIALSILLFVSSYFIDGSGNKILAFFIFIAAFPVFTIFGVDKLYRRLESK